MRSLNERRSVRRRAEGPTVLILGKFALLAVFPELEVAARVTIGQEDENQIFLAALGQVLQAGGTKVRTT